MGQKRIILYGKQPDIIRDLLKTDTPETDRDTLCKKIAEEAKVELWIAETFVDSQRYWKDRDVHTGKLIQEGGGLSKDGAEKAIAELDTKHSTPYFTEQKMPIAPPKKDPITGNGTVAQIIKLAEEGKSVQEIIAMGFNRNTVYRQVGEWRKRKGAAKEQPAAKQSTEAPAKPVKKPVVAKITED